MSGKTSLDLFAPLIPKGYCLGMEKRKYMTRISMEGKEPGTSLVCRMSKFRHIDTWPYGNPNSKSRMKVTAKGVGLDEPLGPFRLFNDSTKFAKVVIVREHDGVLSPSIS